MCDDEDSENVTLVQVDDGVVNYFVVQGSGGLFEYFRAHLGDTQVGAAFSQGGAEAIVENADGTCSGVQGNEYSDLCDFLETLPV